MGVFTKLLSIKKYLEVANTFSKNFTKIYRLATSEIFLSVSFSWNKHIEMLMVETRKVYCMEFPLICYHPLAKCTLRSFKLEHNKFMIIVVNFLELTNRKHPSQKRTQRKILTTKDEID